MGCASCAKKYRQGSARVGKFQRSYVQKKANTMINAKGVVVQPQPERGNIVVQPPTGEIDPSTGQSVAIIKTGSDPTAVIPDPGVKPLSPKVVSYENPDVYTESESDE